VSQIRNRRPGLGGDLDMCVHRYQNWLAVHHASTLKYIKSKLVLSKEELVCLMLYRDAPKVMEGLEVLHGEFPLEGRYGVLQKCCSGYGEDNAINIKQQIYRICAASEDE
jgi:hypothetical protein